MITVEDLLDIENPWDLARFLSEHKDELEDFELSESLSEDEDYSIYDQDDYRSRVHDILTEDYWDSFEDMASWLRHIPDFSDSDYFIEYEYSDNFEAFDFEDAMDRLRDHISAMNGIRVDRPAAAPRRNRIGHTEPVQDTHTDPEPSDLGNINELLEDFV